MKMWLMCVFTVAAETTSSAQISALLRPWAMSVSTSSSRGVRSSALNTSTDGGSTWSRPRIVNLPPALSAVHPTVAASGPGQLEIAWYGADRNGDSNDLKLMGTPGAPGAATWRVYVAKSTDHGEHFDQLAVSSVVHTAVVCTTATTCTTSHSRNLFDDFGIAISPTTHLASVAYTIDNVTVHPESASTAHLEIGYATELPPGAARPPSNVQCLDRRTVTVEVPAARGARIVRAEAYLGRRRLRDLRGRNIKRITLRLPRLPNGTFRITIVAHSDRGGRIVAPDLPRLPCSEGVARVSATRARKQ
jgi:hypothetical protein